MLSDTLVFVVSLLITGAVLFLLIYFVITISDLECDYLNAQQCCSKLNMWVVPKLIAHSAVIFLLMMYGHWWLLSGNLPMCIWMIYELASVPSGNMGVYDPTEIHNRGMLKKHMRDCMIYLGFYLTFFFIYLYCLIDSMLKDDPIQGMRGVVPEVFR